MCNRIMTHREDTVTAETLRDLHTYHLQCAIELDDQISDLRGLLEYHEDVLDRIDDWLEGIGSEP